MEEYRTELTATPRFEETAATLRHALTGEGGGYAVLCLGNLAKALGTDADRFLRLVTGFAAEVAVPFSPFPRWPLWKDIGVKVDKDPGKSSGIGYNAFHMDLVNGTLPPDYTTLLCVRPDPLGGGPSILSDAHAAVARLSENSRALLAETAYHYGTFFDLHGVGEEYKPFPILNGSDPGGFVRFTAKMLKRSELGETHADAARELAEELVRQGFGVVGGRPFRDHLSPSRASGRSALRALCRSAAAMLVAPASRRAPMARLRQVAIARGALPVRSCGASSANVVSLTWCRASICQ